MQQKEEICLNIISIDENTYVSSVDEVQKTVETTCLLSKSMVVEKDAIPKLRRIAKSKFPYNGIKFIQLEKIDHSKLVMEVERSINELYEGYEPRWDMADWKNGTEELALEAKRIAQSDHINDTHVFSDFSKIVAQNIANKYNLRQ